MEAARALMDSLMGQTRDVDLKEAKKQKGKNFLKDNTCKFYLLGFCPQHEDLFKNTKKGHLQIGDCEKVHSDALRDEYEAHPEKVSYERTYTRDLVRYLESLTRKVDEVVKRQQENIEAANKELEEKGPNEIAKQQIKLIRENCDQLLKEAEELAEQGDVEGSKMKMALQEQTKERADEYEAKSKEPMKEEVCDICGLRPEDGDGVRTFTHSQGRIHVGFVTIREWITKLKARLEVLEEERSKKREEVRSKEEADAPAKDSGDVDNRDATSKAVDRDSSKRDREGDRDLNDRDDDGRGERGSRRGGDRDQQRDDRAYDRRGDRDNRGGGYDRDNRGGGYDRRGGDRGYERGDRGDRGYGGRGGDRGDRGGGYGDGYGRGRSRSGGRRR